jgi:hypothetical protein
VCNYTQAFPSPSPSPTPTPTPSAEEYGGIVTLNPLAPDLAFDGAAVEECRGLYRRVVGEECTHGFLEVTEEMRRQLAAEEEEYLN